jgi:4-hydroxy-2-oxoheptanedioate aldolase
VPQLDVLLVGPHDLSINLGIPEQYDHPRFEAAIRTIISKARRRGVGVGIHFSNGLAHHIDWAKAGANFILHSSDLTLFSQTLAADLATFRAAVGESGGSGESRGMIV